MAVELKALASIENGKNPAVTDVIKDQISVLESKGNVTYGLIQLLDMMAGKANEGDLLSPQDLLRLSKIERILEAKLSTLSESEKKPVEQALSRISYLKNVSKESVEKKAEQPINVEQSAKIEEKTSVVLSLEYFLTQRRIEHRRNDESAKDFINRITDELYSIIGKSINDWKFDHKNVRTANWDEDPFYGPNSQFKLRDAIQITPDTKYSISTLDAFLDNFPSLTPDAPEQALEMVSRLKKVIHQQEIAHNRGAVMRTNKSKESPDGFVSALNEFKNNHDLNPNLGDFFVAERGSVSRTGEKKAGLNEMTEREKNINLGTEYLFRVFCSMSLKDWEKEEPEIKNSYLNFDNRADCLPYYRASRAKRETFRNELIGELNRMGVVKEEDVYNCLQTAVSMSIGLGIDVTLDWVQEWDGSQSKLVSTISAGQDAAPKVIFPAYLGSTDKDTEKKKPNMVIPEYIGQAVGPYARTAFYTYEDNLGKKRRDCIVRIAALGKLRTVDWSTGTSNVDESVSDQFMTYYKKIYETQAFCGEKNLFFIPGVEKSQLVNEKDELEHVKGYLGVVRNDAFERTSRIFNNILSRTPLINKFAGPTDPDELNYLAFSSYLDSNGTRLNSTRLNSLAESYYQPYLVDFRQYWVNALKSDIDRYPWDTIQRLRYVFSNKANVPGLDGAVNQHIKDLLWDGSLDESSVTPTVAKDICAEVLAYLKYGFLPELTLYPFIPLYKNNKDFEDLMNTGNFSSVVRHPNNTDEKYSLSTPSGLPALSSPQIDALLGGLKVAFMQLSGLGRADVGEPVDAFTFSPGYDPAHPDLPFTKAGLLKHIKNKYKMGLGYTYKNMGTKRVPDWQLRPINKHEHNAQSLINLVTMFNMFRPKKY